MNTASEAAVPPSGVRFELPRPVLALYAATALALSLVLLAMAQRRSAAELAWWVAAYAVIAGYSVWRPSGGPLAAGFAAFLLGFARTWRHGPNLDLGTSLILLSLAVFLWREARPGERVARVDLAGLLLAAVSGWSLLSLAFAVARIRSFAPAPGFGYHVYRLNTFGLSSEDAITRVVLNAAVTFAWFGAYQYARSLPLPRRGFALALAGVLLANSAALVVERYVAPGFLHPAGWPFYDRWNGVTSFCYALGDAALAFFLLLPAWASARRWWLTPAILLLLLHAVVGSGSRTALATIVAVGLLWTALRVVRLARAGRRRSAGALLAAACLLVAALGVAYAATPADQSTPLGRLKEGVERQGWIGHVVATRLNSYPLLFRLIEEYPLSGIGAGLYPVELEKQRALLMPGLKILDPFIVSSNAPNQLLNTGVELGLPAMLALALVLVLAVATALSRRRAEAADLGVAALGLLAALQLGPGFYNSEALVFEWLVIGLAARGSVTADEGEESDAVRVVAAAKTGGWLAGALVLGLVGQLLAWPALAIDRQWQALRWRMNIGMQPKQAEGQWTGAEATFSVDTSAPAVRVRWHAGDTRAATYRAEVAFYVDGRLVEKSPSRGGQVRESVLPLPAVSGFKRISVRVAPPFVPARAVGGSDERALGIFLHSVTPDAAASPRPPS